MLASINNNDKLNEKIFLLSYNIVLSNPGNMFRYSIHTASAKDQLLRIDKNVPLTAAFGICLFFPI